MEESKEKLISCFVVEPIRYKGERVINKVVDLTQTQVDKFKKIKPCPVREMDAIPAEENTALGDTGLEPAGTDAHLAQATAEPEPKADPDVTVSVDNEPAAKAEAKARNKADK